MSIAYMPFPAANIIWLCRTRTCSIPLGTAVLYLLGWRPLFSWVQGVAGRRWNGPRAGRCTRRYRCTHGPALASRRLLIRQHWNGFISPRIHPSSPKGGRRRNRDVGLIHAIRHERLNKVFFLSAHVYSYEAARCPAAGLALFTPFEKTRRRTPYFMDLHAILTPSQVIALLLRAFS